MTKQEKNFQTYFMKVADHCRRSSTAPGEPDTQVIRGLRTYRVELKILQVGSSGDKKIKPVFKPTQSPWYIDFICKGGLGLYVLFRLNKGYGILKVDKRFCLNINNLYYSDLIKSELYREYDNLKELISETFK